MELSCFLETSVLRIGIDPFVLQLFLYDFAFDESLGFAEVLHLSDYFRISRDDIFLQIGLLWPLVILYPGGAVLLTTGLVKSAFSGSYKRVLS